MPRVSVVVVNWNGSEHLSSLLPSLASQKGADYDVTVVDNGSSDDSVEVARQFGYRVLQQSENLGLARAFNEGALATSSDYLLFLNNDVRVPVDFIARLQEPLVADQHLFATDARQVNWSGDSIIRRRVVLTRRFWPLGDLPGFELSQIDSNCPAPTLFGSGASTMIRRSMFDVIGGWNPEYRLGWEDLDLGWRAWSRGWVTLYVPAAWCWHRVGGSSRTSTGAQLIRTGALRGRVRFACDHLRAIDVACIALRLLVGAGRDLVLFDTSVLRDRITALGEVRLRRRSLERSRWWLEDSWQRQLLFPRL